MIPIAERKERREFLAAERGLVALTAAEGRVIVVALALDPSRLFDDEASNTRDEGDQ
jgi:hypothetical protein